MATEGACLIRSSASEKCQQEKRKTVNGEDILFAMTSTGFENYAEALKIYLAKYREVSCVCSPPHGRSNHLLYTSVRTSSSALICESQSQSQRGDNQQPRPGSGYGAPGGGQPGAGAPGTGGAADPSTSAAYQGQDQAVNNILSPHGLDPSQQQPDPYGGVYPTTANNVVAADPY